MFSRNHPLLLKHTPPSPSPPPPNNTAMSAPKPKWFISRGAGTYTALIPVDELPYTIQLQGVPRAMTADQVIGLNFVAETGPAQQRFLLERQPQLTGHGLLESPSAVRSAKQFFAPDAFVKEIKILSEEATSRAETSTDTEDCQVCYIFDILSVDE